jgi:Ca2+-binding RTX toxin-like protein
MRRRDLAAGMRRGVCLAPVALLVWGATVAQGATVTVVERWLDGDEDSYGEAYDDVLVRGERGERNHLSITVGDREVIVRDAVTPLRPRGQRCRSTTAREVRCRLVDDRKTSLTVRAAGGPDRVTVAGAPWWLSLYGGDGPDVLRIVDDGAVVMDGGPGNDRLVGGTGDDWLFGGDGNDRLFGRAGSDALFGDEDEGDDENDGASRPGSDRLDGGPGRDAASYRAHRHAVRVDLRSGRASGRGERDVLRGIEDAQGGRGDDQLLGDDRGNTLEGLQGSDLVAGGGGDDGVDGGGDIMTAPNLHGATFITPVDPTRGDRASGDAGNDLVRSGGAIASGGDGEDTCEGGGTEAAPQRLPGCEWWSPARAHDSGGLIGTDVQAAGGLLRVTVNGTLSLRVTLARDPATTIAEGVVITPATFLALTPAGQALLAVEPRPVELLVTGADRASAVLTLR